MATPEPRGPGQGGASPRAAPKPRGPGRGGASSPALGGAELPHLPRPGRGGRGGAGRDGALLYQPSPRPSTAHGTLRTSLPATGLAAARP